MGLPCRFGVSLRLEEFNLDYWPIKGGCVTLVRVNLREFKRKVFGIFFPKLVSSRGYFLRKGSLFLHREGLPGRLDLFNLGLKEPEERPLRG